MIVFLLILAILPVILLGRYVYCKDKNKEPKKLLLGFFILGIMAAIITVGISLVINNFIPIFGIDESNLNPINLFIHVFFCIALIEELSKWIFTYLIGYNHKEFDEMYDMIVYAVFVALGFACLENILYIIGDGTVAVSIYRGLLSVPGHVCYGIFMGYYLAMAKFHNVAGNKQSERINKIKSLLIPIILHTVYDYCCFIKSNIFIIIFFVFIINLYILAHGKLKTTANMMAKLKK